MSRRPRSYLSMRYTTSRSGRARAHVVTATPGPKPAVCGPAVRRTSQVPISKQAHVARRARSRAGRRRPPRRRAAWAGSGGLAREAAAYARPRDLGQGLVAKLVAVRAELGDAVAGQDRPFDPLVLGGSPASSGWGAAWRCATSPRPSGPCHARTPRPAQRPGAASASSASRSVSASARCSRSNSATLSSGACICCRRRRPRHLSAGSPHAAPPAGAWPRAESSRRRRLSPWALRRRPRRRAPLL
jgi:hypothetical protein